MCMWNTRVIALPLLVMFIHTQLVMYLCLHGTVSFRIISLLPVISSSPSSMFLPVTQLTGNVELWRSNILRKF